MRRLLFLAVLVLIAASCTRTAAEPIPATLVEVVDGDTVRLRTAGATEYVRLIGINTPESGECHAAEATAGLRSLLAAGNLSIEHTGPDDRDRFGRLLRYVYAGDTLVNLAMLEHGHGLALSSDHDLRGAFADAAEQAWLTRVGMWGAHACGSVQPEQVVISDIEADPPGNDEDRPNDEYVALRNDGAVVVDMSGWRLRDESSTNRFTFEEGFALPTGATVTVHSGCGTPSKTDVYWCSGPVWSNGGDTAVLLAPGGNAAARLVYSGR